MLTPYHFDSMLCGKHGLSPKYLCWEFNVMLTPFN